MEEGRVEYCNPYVEYKVLQAPYLLASLSQEGGDGMWPAGVGKGLALAPPCSLCASEKKGIPWKKGEDGM